MKRVAIALCLLVALFADELGGVAFVADASGVDAVHGLPTLAQTAQAVRDLQLPVVIAHDVDEADVVMTLKNEYKQKTPMLRDAEDRSMPIYVLKSNTIPQMQSSLTSIFALEIDPREAALRETAEETGLSKAQMKDLGVAWVVAFPQTPTMRSQPFT